MRLGLLTIVLALLTSLTAHAATNIMPLELAEFAKKKGCVAVEDFFARRPGMLNPPYVYGYLSGPRENSAVFWCEAREGERRRFFLVLMRREGPGREPVDLEGDASELGKCPNKIEWMNYPRGLQIYRDKQTTLRGFVYVEDPRKTAPPDVRMTHNAVLSEYDGVEELFYCYHGKWLVRQRH